MCERKGREKNGRKEVCNLEEAANRLSEWDKNRDNNNEEEPGENRTKEKEIA